MKLAMLLIALLSLAATVAGVCEDENKPNDPGFCQREVGEILDKIVNCEKQSTLTLCLKSCGYCDDNDTEF